MLKSLRPRVCAGLLALFWLLPDALAAGPLDAVVGVRARMPADAFTAKVLGTEREGSGVVIDENGLVLTIGYLILEAETAEILLPGGRTIPAEVLAYDYDTGYGLLKPLARLGIGPIELGTSSALEEHSEVLIASFGTPPTPAHVVSRREFAGYWEYLLPNAIFTTPPHRTFGGAVLLGRGGTLLGIGSLFVPDAVSELALPGNMFVPIDALKPILADLLERGRSNTPPRPWLGLYAEELRGRIFVNRVAPEGPAAAAGLLTDDIILAVKGAPIASLADFYRKIWALGTAGVEVPITVIRGMGLVDISVTSADRYDFLKLKSSY